MKRITLVITVLVSVLMLGACASRTVVYERQTDRLPVTGKSWTVLVYLCGSNGETESRIASDKLSQLMNVDYPENITVAVQTGGSAEWHTKGIYSDYSQRFEIGKNTMYLADQAIAANMGDYRTLEDFLNWGTSNYKSDNYMLILSGTGGGCVNGLLSDEQYENDGLTLEEMSYAMSLCGKKFDIVGLDASLMGGIETASSLSTCADYLVASQSCQNPDSWDYEGIMNYICSNPSVDAEEVGKAMCDTYYSKCVSGGVQKDAAMSVTDMSQISSLTQAFDGMAGYMITASDSLDNYAALADAVSGVHVYGGATVDEGYSNLIDLGDMAVKIRENVGSTADGLINALNEAVIYRVCGERQKDSTGMSVYYPLCADNDELQEYMEISAGTKYKEYLRKICVSCSVTDDDGTKDYTDSWAWKTYNEDMQWMEYKTILNGNSYELNILGNMKLFSDVSVNVYKKNKKNDDYVFIRRYGDIESEWDAGIFRCSDKVETLRLLGQNVTARFAGRCGECDVYSIPVLLNGERSNIRAELDSDGKCKIIGAWSGLDEKGQVTESMRSVGVFDRITPVLAVYDSEHKKTDYITGPFGLKLFGGVSEDNPGDGSYIFEYELTDVYGAKRHGTPVKAEILGGEIRFE